MDLFTDRTFQPFEIEEFLLGLFPKLTFFNWDFSTEQPNGFDAENQFHMNFHIESNNSLIEFQNCITLYRMPQENVQQRFLYIGKRMSDKYEIRVLVGFRIPDKEYDPYRNIIFEKGKNYLVEDFDTDFGGWHEGKKPIKVENEYSLELIEFDEYANAISQ